MGSMRIVVDPPRFDLGARVLDRHELRDVQTLIAQSSVERLYVPVLSGLSRMDEVEFYAALVCPVLERSGSELRSVIYRNRHGRPGMLDRSIQGRDHVAAGERKPRLKQRSLATKLIDHGEHPKWPSIE